MSNIKTCTLVIIYCLGNVYKHIQGVLLKSQFQELNNTLTLDKVREILNKLDTELKSLSNKYKRLKNYCPWLANFSAGRLNLELEIPGQYSGDKLPLVQHHVKISGFCAEVCLNSCAILLFLHLTGL